MSDTANGANEAATSTVAARRATWAICAAVFVATAVLHVALLPAQGLTDDDDFYAPAAMRYADWATLVPSDPAHALSQPAIDAAFSRNAEHPPLAKYVMGLSHLVLHDGLGVMNDLDAARAGTALFAALCAALAALLALWLRPGERIGAIDVVTAVAAPALLLSLPRFFFHSEVATLDVPVAAMVAAITAAFFASTAPGARRRIAVLCGVVFALGNLTKLNAPFALVPCLLAALASSWRGLSWRARTLPPVPRALPWMAVCAPVLFVLLWPWLWHDTLPRIGAYVAFHLHHYPIYLFYDGVVFEKPFAPWHAPFVLGFGSMPAPVVALGAVGVVVASRALVRTVRQPVDRPASRADQLRGLVLLQAAFAIGITSFLDVPKYGGEKLFMPLFPLWCVLAADGARTVAISALALLRAAARPSIAAVAVVVVAALAVAPGAVGTAHFFGGYALSYYGELVGGLRGAVARGYERSYYDVADRSLARVLDELGRGAVNATVHFEPNHKEYVRTYRWLARSGEIKRVDLVDDRAVPADLVVLTHERRWRSYPALWQRLHRLPVVHERAIDGVPLYTVYRRDEPVSDDGGAR